jgi:hypothetical protein
MAAPQPTLAGFQNFIVQTMGISTTVLPADSPVIPFALAVAMGIVNQQLCAVPIPSADAAGVSLNSGGITVYVFAVYNLAGSNLLSFAQDLPGAMIVPGSISDRNPNGLPFFAYSRQQWQINAFVSGVVQSTADESTSTSLVVMDAAKMFVLSDLQNLKNPYGRQYLAFAQSAGPTTWGLS